MSEFVNFYSKISDRVVLSIVLCQNSSKSVLTNVDTPISGEICYRILTHFSNSDTLSEIYERDENAMLEADLSSDFSAVGFM